MERVAAKIGIRTPSLYHHFPGGKKELLLELVETCTREDSEAIRAILASDQNYMDRLGAIARYFASSVGRHPYHTITESRKYLPKQTRDELQRKFAEGVEKPLLTVIQEGMDSGCFRPCNPMLAVRALLVLLLNLGEVEATDRERDQLPAFFIDIFVCGLQSR